MNLIFLYGPPAAGKLTVAKELAGLTGYRVFHNHLSRDAVTAVFPIESPEYTPTVRGLRLSLLRAAAEANLPGLVFTFVFYRGEDEPFVEAVAELMSATSGHLRLVQLACDRATLARRVTDASRRRFGKLVDREGLSHVLQQHDVFSRVPHRESLTLDSATRDPLDNARAIVEHYTLPRLAEELAAG